MKQNQRYDTTGNPQGDPCFGTRPWGESADPRCPRVRRAKQRSSTIDSAHPPWASPGGSCLRPPRYLLLLLCFRGFPSPHHRLGRNHILPHPQRRSRAGTSATLCQSPRTARQPPDGQPEQQPAGPRAWLAFHHSRKCYCLAADSTALSLIFPSNPREILLQSLDFNLSKNIFANQACSWWIWKRITSAPKAKSCLSQASLATPAPI